MSQPKIIVNERHIAEAIPSHSGKCMVAEAIKDAIPGAHHAHADMATLRYTDAKGVRRTSLTPSAVQTALVRFDAGDEVKPFVFVLPKPIHINKVTPRSRANGRKQKVETSDARGHNAPTARVGGRPVPIIGRGKPRGNGFGNTDAGSRRLFGVRNMRINQQGQVEQLGVLPENGD